MAWRGLRTGVSIASLTIWLRTTALRAESRRGAGIVVLHGARFRAAAHPFAFCKTEDVLEEAARRLGNRA